MPWTAKTRAVAWRRVNAEPDTPRSVIAAEVGVSAKALRDLIKEKEGETGTRAKRVKRGRPKRREIAWDFVHAINRGVGRLDDWLAWQEELRAALRAKRLGRTLSLYEDAEAVADAINTPAGLAFVLSLTGDPRRRESDHLDIVLNESMVSPKPLRSLAQDLSRSATRAERLKFSKDGGKIRIRSQVRLAPWAGLGFGRVSLRELGQASLWFRKVSPASDLEKEAEGRYLTGVLRREIRLLDAKDPGLMSQARKMLRFRASPKLPSPRS
jgi:hypothetical protein